LRSLALALALISLLFTAGCWDQREVETLGLVDGIALERGSQGQIKVTVQMLNSRTMSRGAGMAPVLGIKPYQNFSSEGRTVDDALTNLARVTPRRPFYSSVRVVVVAEDLARERDLRELLDFVTRSREVRRNAWFMVSKTPIARFFDENTPLEMTPSSEAESIMDKSRASGICMTTRLGDVVKAAAGKGVSPVAAGLEVTPNAFEAPPDMEARHVMLPEPAQTIAVSGAAVFRDGHLAGWLDDRETNGLLWVRGQQGGVIEVPTPGGEGQVTSLDVMHCHSGIKMIKTGERPAIAVRVDADVIVCETESTISLAKDTDFTALEAGADQIVQGEIEAALSKALAGYRADIFGFGEVVHRSDPGLWKRLADTWSEQLPELPVAVETHVKVTVSGLTSKPLTKVH